MSYELRPITVEEVPAFRAAMNLGFGEDSVPGIDEMFVKQLPVDRTVAAFDGDEIVGNLGDFEMKLTVPGGAQVAMAGTTMVGVRATHRRQGILRAMMHMHMDNAANRRDSVAGLWASEPVIYGRFGFGMATECHDVKIDSRRLNVAPQQDSVSVSMVAAADLLDVVAPFWSRIASQRAGFVERSEAFWEAIALDPEHRRDGASAARHVVAKRGADVVGYLGYRQKSSWDDFVPDGTVVVGVLVGEDVEADRALWHYVTNIDLFPNISIWNAATDDLLAYEVSDPRSVRRSVVDALYVRVLDLKSALEARTYEADGDIVIDVTDNLGYANGAYLLSVTGGVASVEPSTNAPDISLDIRELGAIYLGRPCVDRYARSGLIEGNPDNVRRLDRLFTTARAPWCPDMF